MTDIQSTFYNLNIRTINKENYERKSNTEVERHMLELNWRHVREIKRRIFRHIQWNSIRNTKHY